MRVTACAAKAGCGTHGRLDDTMTQQFKETTFIHAVCEGSAYDVGRMQGEIIQQIPPLKQWMCSQAEHAPTGDAAAVMKQCDRFCPGLNEELQGCADALGAPVAQIVYYLESFLRVTHCSHFAALPSITANKHLLIGRNYDFNDTMDDMTIFSTRVSGKAAHVGTSSLWFGRNDGLNEHGFAVTMSAGSVPPVGRFPGMTPPIQDGFMFWALVRTLLDQCKTVNDALKLIDEFPCCGNPALILADRQGTAAVVEIWGANHAVKQINAASAEQFLCATNHFTLPEIAPFAPYQMRHSKTRYDTITSRLRQAAPNITPETMRSLLSEPYPAGLCAHYYEEYFGTLHSMILDVTTGVAEVCFGSPHVNIWRTFDPLHPAASGEFAVTLPIEHPTPDFWERLPL